MKASQLMMVAGLATALSTAAGCQEWWQEWQAARGKPQRPPGEVTASVPPLRAVEVVRPGKPATTQPETAAGESLEERIQQYIESFPATDMGARVVRHTSAAPEPAGPLPEATSAPPDHTIDRPQPTEPLPAEREGTVPVRPAPEQIEPRSPAKPIVESIAVRSGPEQPEPKREPVEPRPSANLPAESPALAEPRGLKQAIEQAEKKVAEKPGDLEAQFRLHLLYVADGQDDKALALPEGLNEEAAGLLQTLVGTLVAARAAGRDVTVGADAALVAVDGLRNVLKQHAELQIPAAALCLRVDSFGNYDAIEPRSFEAGRQRKVILYCEVRNFCSQRTPQGTFETVMSQRIEILTRQGHSVWQKTNENIKDTCRNRREDFFLVQIIDLPASLMPGEYVLKVSVHDELSAKVNEASLDFTIRPASAKSNSSAPMR